MEIHETKSGVKVGRLFIGKGTNSDYVLRIRKVKYGANAHADKMVAYGLLTTKTLRSPETGRLVRAYYPTTNSKYIVELLNKKRGYMNRRRVKY